MSIRSVILILIIIVNSIFAIKLLQDLVKNRQTLKTEKTSNLFLATSSFVIFFFSSFGISDFAMATILYRKKKIIADKLLPGTLNTQCVLPLAVMAFIFIAVIEVDILTLLVCIVSQIFGAYFGAKYVVKLPITLIRIFISAGLLLTTVFILASKFNFIPSSGLATALTNDKLIIAGILLCLFGALNNVGIGSYAPTMMTIYSLGINPAVAFPIMMGASTFSVAIGSIQFIKNGFYSRKITLFTSTFGVLGVLIGIYLVKSLNVSLLQWVIAVLLFYSGIIMLTQELKNFKDKEVLQSEC